MMENDPSFKYISKDLAKVISEFTKFKMPQVKKGGKINMCKAVEDWRKEIEEETAARVEAETAARVEAETAARVEAETAARVEAETAARVEAETTARVTAKVQLETVLSLIQKGLLSFKDGAIELGISENELQKVI